MNTSLSAPHTQAGRLQREILAIYREHQADGMLPTSCRFIWYELIARGIVDKTKARGHAGVKRGVDQAVSEALTYLREAGLVAWDDIEDETRTIADYTAYSDVESGVLAILEHIRRDPWAPDLPPLVLCESRSLAGVLRPLARDYRCPIASLNGQAGGFLHSDLAPLVAGGRRVLFVGDFDYQGGTIEDNARAVLSRYGPLVWVRVALTREQVEAFDLPVIQKADRRFKDGRVHEAVETEALSQRIIIDILRARLDALLPDGVELSGVQVREQTEQDSIREILVAGGAQ